MSIATLCVAGAESTGKSWLAAKLAAHFGIVAVAEYARSYCATHGNDLTLDQLTHIAQVQDSNIRGTVMQSFNAGQGLVIADTDARVTAVWAQFTLGTNPADFPVTPAPMSLYLVTENDLPWEDDGVRRQAQQAQRDRFRAMLIRELDRCGLPHVSIAGTGERRFVTALAAIEAGLRGIAVGSG